MDEHPTLPYPGPPAGADPAPAAPAGQTWIADAIVAKVAAAAAREVEGVEGLRGGIPRRGFIRSSERRRGIIDRVGFATGMTVAHVAIGVVDVVPRPGVPTVTRDAPPAPA